MGEAEGEDPALDEGPVVQEDLGGRRGIRLSVPGTSSSADHAWPRREDGGQREDRDVQEDDEGAEAEGPVGEAGVGAECAQQQVRQEDARQMGSAPMTKPTSKRVRGDEPAGDGA